MFVRSGKGKIAVAVLLLLSLMLTLCGCPPRAKLALQYDEKLFTDNNRPNGTTVNEGGEEPEVGYQDVRLFFDNTFGMYGWMLAGAGQSSDLFNMFTQVRSFMNQYKNKEFFTLVDEGNTTKWVPRGEREFDTMGAASFFNVQKPLVNPFSVADLNPDEKLNIYITDLREGAEENKRMADDIYKVVTGGKDRSALMYCFLGRYDGEIWVDTNPPQFDEHGKIIQISQKVTLTNSPFFMFVVGPTPEVAGFYDKFGPSLHGFTEGNNYFCEKFLAGRGVSRQQMSFRTDPFMLTETQSNGDLKPIRDEFLFGKTDLDFDAERVEGNQIFRDLQQNLPGLCYRATSLFSDSLSGDQKYEHRFSFVVDQPRGDTSEGDSIEYSLDLDAVYGAAVKDRPEEPEETADGDSVIPVSFSQITGTQTEGDLFDLLGAENVNRLLDVEIKLLDDASRKINVLKDEKGEKTEEELKEELSSKAQDIPFSASIADADAGAFERSYVVTVSTKDEASAKKLSNKYDGLLFCFSANAAAAPSENTPDWVKRFDMGSAQASGAYRADDPQAPFMYINDLLYIFNFLNGTMPDDNLRKAYRDAMKTEIGAFTVLFDFTGWKNENE